jgi:hypothetical protein
MKVSKRRSLFYNILQITETFICSTNVYSFYITLFCFDISFLTTYLFNLTIHLLINLL